MTKFGGLFEGRKLKHEELSVFGFVKSEEYFEYSEAIDHGRMLMKVRINNGGEVFAEVTDADTGEPYTLHLVKGAAGSFVGGIRQEYESLLGRIAADCFEPDVFKSEGAARVMDYIERKYADRPEFLWPRLPDNAVFRRSDTKKWYAALLTVSEKKLGMESDGKAEILYLRMKEDLIAEVIDNKAYFPGYHMNKRHWITICLNGSLPYDEVFLRIDESYELAEK